MFTFPNPHQPDKKQFGMVGCTSDAVENNGLSSADGQRGTGSVRGAKRPEEMRLHSVTKDEEISAITLLISIDAGFGVDLFTVLQVHRLEDGTFAVLETDPLTREEHEKIFHTATEAARAFVERRHVRQLGFDYERDSEED